MSKNPRNLSHGFASVVIFGLDYNLQEIVTSEIPDYLKQVVTDAMAEKPYGKFLKEVTVEFKEAAASSLNVLIACAFTGKAAGDYFAINRFMQSVVVETCSSKQGNIPFNQITVHMDN